MEKQLFSLKIKLYGSRYKNQLVIRYEQYR